MPTEDRCRNPIMCSEPWYVFTSLRTLSSSPLNYRCIITQLWSFKIAFLKYNVKALSLEIEVHQRMHRLEDSIEIPTVRAIITYSLLETALEY